MWLFVLLITVGLEVLIYRIHIGQIPDFENPGVVIVEIPGWTNPQFYTLIGQIPDFAQYGQNTDFAHYLDKSRILDKSLIREIPVFFKNPIFLNLRVFLRKFEVFYNPNIIKRFIHWEKF